MTFPLGLDSGIFEIDNKLTYADPLGQISKKAQVVSIGVRSRSGAQLAMTFVENPQLLDDISLLSPYIDIRFVPSKAFQSLIFVYFL